MKKKLRFRDLSNGEWFWFESILHWWARTSMAHGPWKKIGPRVYQDEYGNRFKVGSINAPVFRGKEMPSDAFTKNPYRSEHSCRLIKPRKGDHARITRGGVGIVLQRTPKGTMEAQALRYPIDSFTRREAMESCRRRGGMFEAARDNPGLSNQEKILLSAFKSYARLRSHDIPGHMSTVVADLEGKGLIHAVPGMRMTWELTPKGRRFDPYKENPELPASGLLDMAVARSIVREVMEDMPDSHGKRRLEKAIREMEQGLNRIEQSHKGHIDFENPPVEMSRYRENDPGDIHVDIGSHNPPAMEVYRHALQIRAKKKDGRKYYHNFKPGARVLGLSDGSILIKSDKGLPLWKMFPKGGK